MMNAAYREWEFGVMERFLRNKEEVPIDFYLKDDVDCRRCYRCHNQYYADNDFIIVYLEDIKEPDKKGGKGYSLLLDFFTFLDYTRFAEEINGVPRGYDDNNEWKDKYLPRSTFFIIENYRATDKLERGKHYYLNLWNLRNTELKRSPEGQNGFPIMGILPLPDVEVNNENKDATLLYMTMPLTYPQIVFSSLQHNEGYYGQADLVINMLKVWNVGQGNYNELLTDNNPYLIYDAGTDVFGNGVAAYKCKLLDELKNGLPMFVLSHWHADHYSLLFALENNDLRRIQYYLLPSYVKNLSVFLLVARLILIGARVDMVKLPFSNKWESIGMKNMTLFANRYDTGSTNDSGLSLFVKGAKGNAMLPGDCKYSLAEDETNECLKEAEMEKDLCLVIPHHGGKAGKSVTFNVPNANVVEGIVSVGDPNRYKHPNDEVMKNIKKFVPKIRMTMTPADLNGDDHIFVEL